MGENHRIRTRIYLLTSLLIIVFGSEMNAQEKKQSLNIETEPLAFIFNGAGMTGAYQHGLWTYSMEAYGFKIPKGLHDNENFTVRLKGIELQVERFIAGNEGFFIGSEISLSRLELTHDPTKDTKTPLNYGVGLRAGYQWNTGLGNLYLSPVVGLSYAINSENVEINQDTFESAPITPWGTIGIGWTIELK